MCQKLLKCKCCPNNSWGRLNRNDPVELTALQPETLFLYATGAECFSAASCLCNIWAWVVDVEHLHTLITDIRKEVRAQSIQNVAMETKRVLHNSKHQNVFWFQLIIVFNCHVCRTNKQIGSAFANVPVNSFLLSFRA